MFLRLNDDVVFVRAVYCCGSEFAVKPPNDGIVSRRYSPKSVSESSSFVIDMGPGEELLSIWEKS